MSGSAERITCMHAHTHIKLKSFGPRVILLNFPYNKQQQQKKRIISSLNLAVERQTYI